MTTPRQHYRAGLAAWRRADQWWTTWRRIGFLTALYSLSRIILGVTYSTTPKTQLPSALQDWTVFPIQVWGALWIIAGALGVWSAPRHFAGRSGIAALTAMIFMNSFWTLAYTYSWLAGRDLDRIAASTYAGTSALILALAMALARLRRIETVRAAEHG